MEYEEYNSTADPDYACDNISGHSSERVIMSYRIYLYAAVFFVFIGLVGNALSIMVFSSKEMRTVSSNFYLLILAISDSLYLVSVFLAEILTVFRCLYIPLSKIDILNRSDFSCKLLQYFLDLFSDYSTCIILAFTIERCIAVYLPLKIKVLCSVKRARIVCTLLFLFTAISIAPYHYMYIERVFGFDVCAVNPEHDRVFSILYIIESSTFRIIPVFVIATLNVFIIVRVSKLTRERIHMMQQGNNTTTICAVIKKSVQLTIMLILVSTIYILAYLPVLCHFVIWQLKRSAIINIDWESLEIAQIYTNALYIIGFACNFFLYMMSGQVFREQLNLLLRAKFDLSKLYF